MIEVTITGADKVQQTVLALAQRVPAAVGAALRDEAELTMTAAKKLAPVVTGTLRASGHVLPPTRSGAEISVTMGFGGATGIGNINGETNETPVFYALSVHENPRAGRTYGYSPSGKAYQDKKGKKGRRRFSTVGQWKYLEQPVLARTANLAERVRARILKFYANG